jgi:hypothetical protein
MAKLSMPLDLTGPSRLYLRERAFGRSCVTNEKKRQISEIQYQIAVRRGHTLSAAPVLEFYINLERAIKHLVSRLQR